MRDAVVDDAGKECVVVAWLWCGRVKVLAVLQYDASTIT
jgi:hypothetical protein